MDAIFDEVDRVTRNLLSLLTGNNVIEISIFTKFNFTLASTSRPSPASRLISQMLPSRTLVAVGSLAEK